DPKQLVGPGDHVGRDVPLEAADVSDALRLLEAAAGERQLLLQAPVLGDLDGGTDAARSSPFAVMEGLEQDLEPVAAEFGPERLPLARQRGQVTRQGRLRRIARLYEI